MICPECISGMVVVLATKGFANPHRETGILSNPARYLKKIPCKRCNGSGIAYCCDGEDASCDAETLLSGPDDSRNDLSISV
ncbi:MAG: hypothetical protein VX617_07725 [Pseudomonadota bacterium]|nr:hypothetical protein [Pseudomonadota bacterium]